MSLWQLLTWNRKSHASTPWFIRNQSKVLSVEDCTEFCEWLESDASRERQYQLAEDAWELTGALADEPEFVPTMALPLASSELVIRVSRRQLIWSIPTAAAVLARVVGVPET